MASRTALLVGATGLVGSHCLEQLLHDGRYQQVVVLARREVGREHPRLVSQVVDFDQLASVPAVDDVYCCLGSTIRAAGSRAAFYRIDHDYPVNVAHLALAAGATRLALVSSAGASPTARNFYLRMKGETERDLAGLGYRCLELFRPSMLMGRRRERQRLRESAAIWLMRGVAPLLVGPARAYRPVAAAQVAAAMQAALRRDQPGTRVRGFDDIIELSAG